MSSQPPKIALPAILLANDLLDGDVVFWTGESWTLDPAGALVAHDAGRGRGARAPPSGRLPRTASSTPTSST